MVVNWKWSQIQDLTANEMHAILAARQGVFIIEQRCIYPDADHLDLEAWHLMGCSPGGQLMAYLRINPPGARFAEPSIGRLMTIASMRGKQLARRALAQALTKCDTAYPGQAIRIAAQAYLVDYYGRFGFRKVGPPYAEDGIEHIDMVYIPAQCGRPNQDRPFMDGH